MDPNDPTWIRSGVPPHADGTAPSSDERLVEGGGDHLSRGGRDDSSYRGFASFAEEEPAGSGEGYASPPTSRQRLLLLLFPLGFAFLLTSLFLAMRGLPLYYAVRRVSGRELAEAVSRNAGYLWPQALGIAAGIPLGVLFFRAVS